MISVLNTCQDAYQVPWMDELHKPQSLEVEDPVTASSLVHIYFTPG